MRLWRISNYADLKGIGGIKTQGRWHNRGIPVVYLSESPALALLETLVHFEFDPDEIPEHYQLLHIDYPGRKGIQHLADNSLASDWRDNQEYTRAIGDEWLGAMKGVLLRVPSAIIPHSYNYLLNPRHELAKDLAILEAVQHPFDARLTQ